MTGHLKSGGASCLGGIAQRWEGMFHVGPGWLPKDDVALQASDRLAIAALVLATDAPAEALLSLLSC
jgi:hypothetical protein